MTGLRREPPFEFSTIRQGDRLKPDLRKIAGHRSDISSDRAVLAEEVRKES
jgi:hypothetical protein